MTRQDYIYELVGTVKNRTFKENKTKGTQYYQLSVEIKNKSEVKKINVFENSCKKEVWQVIKEKNYWINQYIFYCKNFMGSYYLVDWKILKDEEN